MNKFLKVNIDLAMYMIADSVSFDNMLERLEMIKRNVISAMLKADDNSVDVNTPELEDLKNECDLNSFECQSAE